MTSLPSSDDEQALPQWRRRWDELNEQPYFRRASPATVRAAWWAARSVRRAKRELRGDGVAARVPAPPQLPWGARTGVYGVITRLDPTCIERCLVQQAWLHAYGVDRDVIVGVKVGSADFSAHSWIEDMVSPAEAADYRVIHRIAPGA